MKLAVPDLVSPSYFPAIAAVELGCIARRGVPIDLELHFPVVDSVDALRDGSIDFVAGAAHSMLHGAPDGAGVRLLAAVSRHTYWFLVVRPDLGIGPGSDLSALKGCRIGAAPGPDDALVQLLADAGVDPDAVDIGAVPGTSSSDISFGVTAAAALADGLIDGFWANGMGAEVAVRAGTGVVVIDSRRGGGPPAARSYTFAALMSSSRVETLHEEETAHVVAGLVEAQHRLRTEPALARPIADRLFPPMEAGLTAELIARDAPYYDATIHEEDLNGMIGFARRIGHTTLDLAYDDLVSSRFRSTWKTAP